MLLFWGLATVALPIDMDCAKDALAAPNDVGDEDEAAEPGVRTLGMNDLLDKSKNESTSSTDRRTDQSCFRSQLSRHLSVDSENVLRVAVASEAGAGTGGVAEDKLPTPLLVAEAGVTPVEEWRGSAEDDDADTAPGCNGFFWDAD